MNMIVKVIFSILVFLIIIYHTALVNPTYVPRSLIIFCLNRCPEGSFRLALQKKCYIPAAFQHIRC